MRLELRYGRKGLALDVPDSWDVTIVAKNRMPVLPDPSAGVREALDRPVAAGKIEEEARGIRTACILICDVTRPVPNGLILRPVIERLLSAGLPPTAITVLVATGLHRPNEGTELEGLIGDPWVFSHSVVENHFARRDEDHLFLGTTRQGIPVRIDRRVVNADIRIAVGLVEPHFMAGWSGGRKLILPGAAHADTIMAFHSARMLVHPRATTCAREGNPLHETQTEVLGMIGRSLAVNVVVDEQRALCFARYGGIQESLAAAIAFSEEAVRVRLPRAFPVVLSTGAGFPLDATYYQTVKGICAGSSILQHGGQLFAAAACEEGFGSPEFRAAQERLRSLGARRFRAEAQDRARAEIDEWQTFMLLKALDAGTVRLFSEGLSPDEQLLTGAVPVQDLVGELSAAVERAEGRRLAVIPEGPYVSAELERRGF